MAQAQRRTSRRGSITGPGFRAIEYRGGKAAFRGRIAVDRGSGMMEFPDPKQFLRIAREEGYSKDDVDRAFGHMRGAKLKKNGLRHNAKRVVRRGLIATEGFRAEEYAGTEPPFRGRIMLDRGSGMLEFPTVEQLIPMARGAGFSIGAVKQAFGHMLGGLVPESDEPSGPTTYGPRRMKLGHYVEGTGAVTGLKRGQLLLFDKATGAIPWRAFAIDEGKQAGMVKVNNKVVRVDKALTSALERGIPPLAFLQVFGYLINRDDLRRLYAEYA